MCNKNDNHAFTNGALVGFIAGAVLGVLFAPTSGKETRKKLEYYKDDYMERGLYALDNAVTSYEDLKDKATPLIDQVEASLKPLLHHADKAGKPVKDQVLEKIQQLANSATSPDNSA